MVDARHALGELHGPDCPLLPATADDADAERLGYVPVAGEREPDWLHRLPLES